MFKISLRKEKRFRRNKVFSGKASRGAAASAAAVSDVWRHVNLPVSLANLWLLRLRQSGSDIPANVVALSKCCTAVTVLLCFFFGIGCRTLPPLPPANLSEPGWTVREGQAVWRSKRNAPEIAGEIMVATKEEGRAFVQFTKTPFPFVIARMQTNSWQLEVPTRNKRYSGPGHPPERIIWFQIPAALSGKPLPKRWSWEAKENHWRLENHSTGESLEGYFQH